MCRALEGGSWWRAGGAQSAAVWTEGGAGSGSAPVADLKMLEVSESLQACEEQALMLLRQAPLPAELERDGGDGDKSANGTIHLRGV